MDNKKDKRKKILRISSLIGLFLLVFGLSYALFTVTLNGTKKVKVKTGKLELQLLDENNNDITDTNNAGYVINLDNQVPVNDEVGLGTEAFTFKLKNIGTIDAKYTIYLDDVALETGENRLPDSAVRYSLTKNGSSDNAQDLTTIGVNPNRKLDEGVIKQDTTNTYTLKVWIDEEATNEAMDKVFAATLRVEGTQYVVPPAPDYGTKIAEAQITENITAAYYQPDGTGYNNNSVKRISNVRKIDNEEKYEGGTLVISGMGEVPSRSDNVHDANKNALELFLADKELSEVQLDSYYLVEWEDNFQYKYNPYNLVVEEGIESLGDYSLDFIETLKNVILPSSLKYIKEGAFAYTNLESIDLADGIESIGERAFEYSRISEIVLPDSLQEIGEGAFEGTLLRNVQLPSNLKILNSHIFSNCDDLTEIKLNSKIEELKYSSLSAPNLEVLYLPKSIKTIETNAFSSYDTKLKTVYCETQEVANLIHNSPEESDFNIIVDATHFS